MWGIGLLIFIGLCILIFKSVSSLLPPKDKIIFKSLTIIILVTCPFWYYMSPSYYKFKNLCEKNDRVQIYQTAETDVIYEGNGCFSGFKTLHMYDYKGMICRDTFSYERSENWDSEECQVQCMSNNINYTKRDTCIKNCLSSLYIDNEDLSFYSNDSKSTKIEIINNKLYSWVRTLTNEKLGVMAKSINYTYYPYGNSWAKILGASSGSAPNIKCKSRANINIYEVFPVKS